MSHVDDGTLHELIDDALEANTRAAVEAHLASCGECAKRFAEATAMARQVHTLLGALDAVPAPVRIIASTPVRAAALASVNVTPMQQRMRTLRRVALAASVLLVAGISYRVGVSRTTGDVEVARESGSIVARPARQPEAMQGVADAASESAPESAPEYVSKSAPKPAPASVMQPAPESVPKPPPEAIALPSAPTVRAAPRRVLQVEADVATGAAAEPVETMAAPMRAPMAASASAPGSRRAATAVVDSASPAASMQRGVQPTGSTLAGYQMREDVTLPSATRRRYTAVDGTMLELLITPLTADTPKLGATAVPEFTVSTAEGRSTVRWLRSGISYELHGALAPDSLVKLATQLK